MWRRARNDCGNGTFVGLFGVCLHCVKYTETRINPKAKQKKKGYSLFPIKMSLLFVPIKSFHVFLTVVFSAEP